MRSVIIIQFVPQSAVLGGGIFLEKIRNFLDEHLRTVLLAMICVVLLVFAAVIFSLVVGKNGDRTLIITDISGGAVIVKGDGQLPAAKNLNVSSGDVIVTSDNGSVKLKADRGKYIYIEPSSTVYVYYTDKAERGSIIVNISDGSAVCRVDGKLPKSCAFEVRTPNAVASVTGTVFHTDFNYYDTYNGFDDVMVTEFRCVQGTVNTTLYDITGNKAEEPKELHEGCASELMSSAGFTAFNCSDEPFPLSEFSADTLSTLIKISSERTLPCSLADLNAAYLTRSSDKQNEVSEPLITVPQTTASQDVFFTVPETSETTSESTERTVVTTAPEITSEETSAATTVPQTVSPAVTTAAAQTTKPATVFDPPVTTKGTTAAVTAQTQKPTTSTVSVTTSAETTARETEAEISSQPTQTLPPETEETVSEASSETVPWWEMIR